MIETQRSTVRYQRPGQSPPPTSTTSHRSRQQAIHTIKKQAKKPIQARSPRSTSFSSIRSNTKRHKLKTAKGRKATASMRVSSKAQLIVKIRAVSIRAGRHITRRVDDRSPSACPLHPLVTITCLVMVLAMRILIALLKLRGQRALESKFEP